MYGALLDKAEPDLRRFSDLVLKWTATINLVSKSQKSHLWQRHILDSVQVFHVKQDWTGLHADLGSGGGFPGIVCSILKKHHGHGDQTILVETDKRKCAFLRTAIRELKLNASVVASRIEEVPPLNARTVTARALAGLEDLLGYAQRHVAGDGTCLFPKGAGWEKELDSARRTYDFEYLRHQSQTEPEACILQVSKIRRKANA